MTSNFVLVTSDVESKVVTDGADGEDLGIHLAWNGDVIDSGMMRCEPTATLTWPSVWIAMLFGWFL